MSLSHDNALCLCEHSLVTPLFRTSLNMRRAVLEVRFALHPFSRQITRPTPFERHNRPRISFVETFDICFNKIDSLIEPFEWRAN